jgi:hypothetical protein
MKRSISEPIDENENKKQKIEIDYDSHKALILRNIFSLKVDELKQTFNQCFKISVEEIKINKENIGIVTFKNIDDYIQIYKNSIALFPIIFEKLNENNFSVFSQLFEEKIQNQKLNHEKLKIIEYLEKLNNKYQEKSDDHLKTAYKFLTFMSQSSNEKTIKELEVSYSDIVNKKKYLQDTTESYKEKTYNHFLAIDDYFYWEGMLQMSNIKLDIDVFGSFKELDGIKLKKLRYLSIIGSIGMNELLKLGYLDKENKEIIKCIIKPRVNSEYTFEQMIEKFSKNSALIVREDNFDMVFFKPILLSLDQFSGCALGFFIKH